MHKPQTFDIDELLKAFPLEERVYSLRCVEAWSMIIPWVGFPLAALLKRVEPTSEAKYVEFTTLLDPEQFPGQRKGFFALSGLDWPYVEGLRLDEALHPLTLMTVGMYGRVLPNQNGAPIRAGRARGSTASRAPSPSCGSASSRISRRRPGTRPPPRSTASTRNVNPEVSHPRWSQATERRIGEFRRRQTHMFNGYADQVAHLYTGMDLSKLY